jgi:hypothetical protein
MVVPSAPKLFPEITIGVFPRVELPKSDTAAPERAEIVGAAYDVVSVEGSELRPSIPTLQKSVVPNPGAVLHVMDV